MKSSQRHVVRAEGGRFQLKEDTIFILRSLEEEIQVKVKGVDASQRGLGLISPVVLPQGKLFWLVSGKSSFCVEVMHCESYLGIDNMFRCGVFFRDPNANFLDFCSHHSLILSK